MLSEQVDQILSVKLVKQYFLVAEVIIIQFDSYVWCWSSFIPAEKYSPPPDDCSIC